ncbi:MAG TPA: ATP-binding cassette domain-containing protein, partial [bacterium]|nr:ATP-binding cassette domain-containing protein [bacterium]
TMLRTENITAGYGKNTILEDISFSIEKGERFVVLGESGCGKSTLMKAIVGLNPPWTGKIFFKGEEIIHPLPEDSDFYKKIGILYQSSALMTSLSLEENVMLPIIMHYPDFDTKIARDMADEKLAMVNLYNHREKYPQELSGGMKKRGALARAMVMDPDIIFFDEPQAGLDPVTARDLDTLFIKLNEQLGTTYFIVTHELLSIKRTAQKVLMLADKKVLFFGTFDEAMQADIFKVKRFFNVDKYSK